MTPREVESSPPERSSKAPGRARRLLFWYPAAWRARYGEEFLHLLEADIAERPYSLARTFNVARAGLTARLTTIGICAGGFKSPRESRTRLAFLTFLFTVFATFAVASWSQLDIGWRWEAPPNPLTFVGMILMTTALAVFAVLALLPLGLLVLGILRNPSRRLLFPLSVTLASATALFEGGTRFSQRWPGAGGHAWALHDIAPPKVGAFAWAITRWITAYWAHPAELHHFTQAELAWMVMCPAVIALFVVGLVMLSLRVEIGPAPRWLRPAIETLGIAAAGTFLVGLCCWIASEKSTSLLFRTGTVNIAETALLTCMILAGYRCLRTLRLGPDNTLIAS